ncbi:BTB/POZ domain-containing protein At5g17580-like [Cannabis sativa]|uniref:BTB/POZ domain-containing protein At5g17580-like n=1 Tax=Cannabis sativa TaxID=3483 RepID=UPI0029C9F38D|nr:BTB/POZ domain-containing protein At5g17580-like [Cannabis sativa]
MFQNSKISSFSSSSSLHKSPLQIQRSMSTAPSKVLSSWIAKPISSSYDIELYEVLATKCANIDSILKNGSSPKDVTQFLGEITMNSKTLELVISFCQGYEIHISQDNVIQLYCVAHHLGMNETHSKNNLLKRALSYFEKNVLSSWDQTLKSLRTIDNNILDQAIQLGLVGTCLNSLIAKALTDPRLLGEPINNDENTSDRDDEEEEEEEEEEDEEWPKAKRRLFGLSWQQNEDLTTLSLKLYEPLIYEMIKRGVPLNYVTSSLLNYVKKRVLIPTMTERNSEKEIIEAVEKLLPRERGLIIIPCSILLEILRSAMLFNASLECLEGLEFRIGTNLHHASVKDLMIISQNRVDIDCIRRILKHFYGNYSSSHLTGLILVAELFEEFLAEIASCDIDLKLETFMELAELSVSLSMGTNRNSDGLYRAIDIYLDKHKYLTESEREKVCQALDFNNMSEEACDHAAKNERLPLRVTIQVLFVAQLQLRESIMKEVQGCQGSARFGEKKEEEEEEEEEEEARLVCGEEESMRIEMEKMSMKLVELEKECCVIKKEIEKDESKKKKKKKKNEKEKEKKVSLWREMKRKFGCVSNSNCNVSNDSNRHGKNQNQNQNYQNKNKKKKV